ncbi:MAG TPA: FkbM family methyltransferase [Polyangiaceae bacterium]|nr:FkbM family methyltransferase [Polyangiaceae bacterium]
MKTPRDRLKQALRIQSRLRSELVSVIEIGGLACFAAYLGKLAEAAPEVLRKRSLEPADRRMKGRRFAFAAEGQEVSLDGSAIGLAREIYGRRCYFSPPGFGIGPGDTVVELGAQVGVFTTLAAKLARQVVAVEAQIGFVEELRENLRENGCLEKVSIEHGLIGGSRGMLSDEAELRSASHYRGVAPPPISMNDLLKKHAVEAIDFLKMDIEGSEFDVILRDNEWLSITRRIAMEVHCDYGSVDDLRAALVSRGFRVWLFDEESRPTERLPGRSGFLFGLV